MLRKRHVRLFRNGRNQAIRIPREFELEGNEATIHQEGTRLIVEPVHQPNQLLDLLATLKPLQEEFPVIEDPHPEEEDLF